MIKLLKADEMVKIFSKAPAKRSQYANNLDTLQQIAVKNKNSDNFNKKWKEVI